MKWKIKDGIVKDEHGEVVCTLSESATAYHMALIKNASDMFDAIMDFNSSFDHTGIQRKPKKHYDRLRLLEEKINEEVE